MVVLADHPIYKKLLSLNLPSEDHAVFGSGPLFAHGLTKKIRDIDVVARGRAWDIVKNAGKKGKDGGIRVFEGDIEIYNKWEPGNWDINKLIDNAEIIEGIRFVNLETVLKWKKSLARPKDKKHIEKIENYLSGR